MTCLGRSTVSHVLKIRFGNLSLTFRKLRGVTRTTLCYAAAIGALLAVVYGCCTLGVKYTTLSNSAFLISTTVFFTPILAWVFQHKRPSNRLFGALVLVTIGILLMTLKDDFGFNFSTMKGDIFSLSAGVIYAFELILTEKAVQDKRVSPLHLGSFALLFCGIMMMCLAFMTEQIVLPRTGKCWVSLLFLIVFCTAVTNVLQPVCQQYTEASRAGIIFSLEPVFAAVFAFLIAGEVLGMRGFAGAVLMILALVYLEADPAAVRRGLGAAVRRGLSGKVGFSGSTVEDMIRQTEVPRSRMFEGAEFWVSPGPSGPALLAGINLREQEQRTAGDGNTESVA